jgi:ATP-dependent helicase/nuclease subunit B
MDAIAQSHHAAVRWRELVAQLRASLEKAAAHPARTVVLLPYAQLLPLARAGWAEQVPDGFSPRFETTMNWAAAQTFEPAAHDISFELGRDLLTAHSWLERAGLGTQAPNLAGRLVEAAWELAAVARAEPAGERGAWAARARTDVAAGMDSPLLALEAAVARIAIEWAAASSYASDTLLDPATLSGIDLLVVLQGYQAEPLAQSLARLLGDRAVVLPLVDAPPIQNPVLHAARDAAEEAEQAAACVIRHLEQGRAPVALAATDRVLTRRIRALLAARGVALRDETGWKLSTTRAAAQLMAALKSCAWDASSDQVLDWLKHCPALPAGVVLGLERRTRAAGQRDWRAMHDGDWRGSEALATAAAQVAGWRDAMRAPRPLAGWLSALRKLLESSGQWAVLAADEAGQQVLDSLRLPAPEEAEWLGLPQAGRRMDLRDFIAWTNEVLEDASFSSTLARDEPVVILPFPQLLARPFAALVLPGCDEVRLPAAPEPGGPWTAAQRQALGLPSREAIEAAQRAAWRQALQAPHCDVLWRKSDDSGEPLLASPLVQALELQDNWVRGTDPRTPRTLVHEPQPRPRPPGSGGLLPSPLSASAYEDLRRCPYRFFALRLLGLKESEEVDSEVGKRDFGTWLHAVLRGFHEALAREGEPAQGRASLLDACARDALAALRLQEGEFLPFEAGWPAVRDGYLAWLSQHESAGARFAEAESEHQAQLGDYQLAGRIDRLDRGGAGSGDIVIDYKTESLQATRDRMKQPLEDTQLAFYAALLEHDELAAAYLNLSERGVVTLVKHPDLASARDALRAGIAEELTRIGRGDAMPALGEGRACEFCHARGLCRKDWWNE